MKTIAEALNGIPTRLLPLDEGENEPAIISIGGMVGPQRTIVIDRSYRDPALVSPCDVCGHDTFYDVFVAWAALFDGEKLIIGYRLCDDCCRRALKEANERRQDENTPQTLKAGEVGIAAICQLLRVNDGVTVSPAEWRELTTDPPLPTPAPGSADPEDKEGE